MPKQDKINISIIVPAYNVAPYLSRCLNSLLAQTLNDIEIICIDDKSTDNSLKILREYEKKDRRIKVIALDKNSGVAAARNAGMDMAHGEYIGFVDPDDCVDLDFYEKLYNCARKSKSILVKGNVVTTTPDNKKYVNPLNKAIETNASLWSSCFWSGIYQSKFLKENKILFPVELRSGQDLAFLVQVNLLKPSLTLVNDTFYHYYYQRPGSLDAAKLSHVIAQSKLNMAKTNLQFIEKANLSNDDYVLFVTQFVLSATAYNVRKKCENSGDRLAFFDFLVKVCQNHLLQNATIKIFGEVAYRAIIKNQYKPFIKYIDGCRSLNRQRSYYLFGFIPLLKIEK